MQDIPMFTTEYGVASLILKEIPYRQLAFIHIQDVQPGQLKQHLCECIGFCRACGAEKILAKGPSGLTEYPLHSIVYKMSMPLQQREPEAALWPVTPESVASWREIYNKAMRPFDNHATLTTREEAAILNSGGAYFVHQQERLLGIGWLEDAELLALVSVVPGMGETVAWTLLSAVQADQVTLEVVSNNTRAIRLYERMGFVKVQERTRWYRVL